MPTQATRSAPQTSIAIDLALLGGTETADLEVPDSEGDFAAPLPAGLRRATTTGFFAAGFAVAVPETEALAGTSVVAAVVAGASVFGGGASVVAVVGCAEEGGASPALVSTGASAGLFSD